MDYIKIIEEGVAKIRRDHLKIMDDWFQSYFSQLHKFDNWISVKDKLPCKYERVLVTDGKQICLHYKQSFINWEDDRGHDLYCSCPLNHDRCDFVEGSITHWRELPELPKD